MSDSDTAYKTGYRHPPLHTRWRKGQSGNPSRKTKGKLRTFQELVDEFLAAEISITENGVRRRCTVFEAILTQLWIKSRGGSRRATRVLLRYIEFSKESGGLGGITLATRKDDGSIDYYTNE